MSKGGTALFQTELVWKPVALSGCRTFTLTITTQEHTSHTGMWLQSTINLYDSALNKALLSIA